MFYSQFNQDEYIYNTFFKNKKDKGFFLEIGADDGIRFSNCYYYEKNLNWDGIAIEPRKDAYNKLIQNRKCICENVALSNIEEKTEFLDIKGYGLGLSGLINKYDPRHLTRIKQETNHPQNKGSEIITVNTVKLDTILDKYKVKNIDFLSIDTEGSEIDILSTIDFNKYKINVITIEDNYNNNELNDFFIKRDFEFVKQICCDKVFKNKIFNN